MLSVSSPSVPEVFWMTWEVDSIHKTLGKYIAPCALKEKKKSAILNISLHF